MKRTLLSASVAIAITTSSLAFAEYENPPGQSMGGNILTEALSFGGHVGGSLEYEDKTISNYQAWGGSEESERTTTHEPLTLFYSNSHWNFYSLYSFKFFDRIKRSEDKSYTETEDGHKHLLSLNKKFSLPNGFEAGLIYDLEYTKGFISTTAGVSGLRTKIAEHSVRPYLNYWSNNYDFGVQSNLEYLYLDEDKNAWGTREEEGYSVLVKPYKRIGNWELGVEFFYQVKKNNAWNSAGAVNEVSDFTEKYVEPIIQYSFEDAGTLYVRTRIGENDTKFTDGWAKDEEFFKDIRKGTIGYEQSVGEDWVVKGEYEWAKDTETFSQLSGDEKEIEQSTFFVQAIYRL